MTTRPSSARANVTLTLLHGLFFIKLISTNVKLNIVTDSFRYVVGVRCQAITQVKQLVAGSVLETFFRDC